MKILRKIEGESHLEWHDFSSKLRNAKVGLDTVAMDDVWMWA